MNNVTAKTAEEFALVLEPFPFLDDETKSRLVEKSKPFFEFLKYMTEKHNTTSDVIQARIDMKVNAKMAAKMAEMDKNPEVVDDSDEAIANMVCEIFTEISAEEGFDGDLGGYAIEIMGMRGAMEAHVEKLIAEGREEELKNFVDLMERSQG